MVYQQLGKGPLAKAVALGVGLFVRDTEGHQLGCNHWHQLQRLFPLTDVAVDLGEEVTSADFEVFEVAHSLLVGTVSLGEGVERLPRALLMRFHWSSAWSISREWGWSLSFCCWWVVSSW